MTPADSLRIGRQLVVIDSLAAVAKAESAYCALPIVTRLLAAHDTTVVRQAKGAAAFRWTDVPPGIYRLMAFRDVNKDGRLEADEPTGALGFVLDLQPLHTLDSLNVILSKPAGKK